MLGAPGASVPPFTVTVDWSARSKPLRVVDGKGDANVNNITITPKAGQTQLAVLNFSYVIAGAGVQVPGNDKQLIIAYKLGARGGKLPVTVGP